MRTLPSMAKDWAPDGENTIPGILQKYVTNVK
jgi:hypothetical protein